MASRLKSQVPHPFTPNYVVSLKDSLCKAPTHVRPAAEKSVAPPRPPSVKGKVLAMLACGCAWLRSRFAPLTAAAALLPGSCRLRRNVGLCLTRGMRGCRGDGTRPLLPSLRCGHRYAARRQL